jgi:sugar lactone lactonase YvrE
VLARPVADTRQAVDATRELVTIERQATAGLNRPNALAVSSDGHFVFATSRSDAIVTFTRDTAP